MKNLLVLYGFLNQKFAGNLEEVGQIVLDSARHTFLSYGIPGNQTRSAIFCQALSDMILSGCLGLGVARA